MSSSVNCPVRKDRVRDVVGTVIELINQIERPNYGVLIKCPLGNKYLDRVSLRYGCCWLVNGDVRLIRPTFPIGLSKRRLFAKELESQPQQRLTIRLSSIHLLRKTNQTEISMKSTLRKRKTLVNKQNFLLSFSITFKKLRPTFYH